MTRSIAHNRRQLWLLAAGWVVIALWIAVATPGRAQAPAVTSPSFEVASVRLVSGERGSTSVSPPGSVRFTARNASMKLLIEYAFGVDDKQISGENLGWLDSEAFDVEAKPEGDVILSYEQMKPLLQNLLAQRFKLVFHREQKDFESMAWWSRRMDRNSRPARSLPRGSIFYGMA